MNNENLKLNRQGCFRLYTAARLLIQVYQPWFAQLGITYTPLIKRMEAMKLVTRKKSKDDGRQTIIALTEHGRALQQQATVIPDCMADVLHEKGMTDEEFAAIIPTLDHLIEVLSKN